MSDSFLTNFVMGIMLTLTLIAGFFIGYTQRSICKETFDYHKITCLELNLGKETCDKIFKKKYD